MAAFSSHPTTLKSGFSLIEVLVAMAVSTILFLALGTMTAQNSKLTQSLAQKLDYLELKSLVTGAMMDGSICTKVMTDTSYTFDPTNPAAQVGIPSLPASAAPGTPPALLQPGPIGSNGLKVLTPALVIDNIRPTGGTNSFTANFNINLDPSSMASPIKSKPIAMFLTTDSGTPAARILSCTINSGGTSGVITNFYNQDTRVTVPANAYLLVAYVAGGGGGAGGRRYGGGDGGASCIKQGTTLLVQAAGGSGGSGASQPGWNGQALTRVLAVTPGTSLHILIGAGGGGGSEAGTASGGGGGGGGGGSGGGGGGGGGWGGGGGGGGYGGGRGAGAGNPQPQGIGGEACGTNGTNSIYSGDNGFSAGHGGGASGFGVNGGGAGGQGYHGGHGGNSDGLGANGVGPGTANGGSGGHPGTGQGGSTSVNYGGQGGDGGYAVLTFLLK